MSSFSASISVPAGTPSLDGALRAQFSITAEDSELADEEALVNYVIDLATNFVPDGGGLSGSASHSGDSLSVMLTALHPAASAADAGAAPAQPPVAEV